MQRTLDDVVDALCHSRDVRKWGCSLLIGAGCSATAGVETAAGFVKLIKDRFKGAFGRAAEKTYPKCMAELSRGQQRDLIIEQVAQAKINWAHMAIAQLIRNGYVDRVLTTNFDPLVLRACAMLGEFPAVYDFAISQLFRPGELPERAIFHLHGQSTGFVLMNTAREVETHSERLGPLFQDAGQARPWIVVGYSGDNDPVFNHLAAVERFDYCLFWVGFKDEEPKAHVREKLLRPGKDAFLVPGYDADRFFVELAQKLQCFPPAFVQRPFSFLKSTLTVFSEFPLLPDEEMLDVLEEPRRLLDQAIERFEEVKNGLETMGRVSDEARDMTATALLMAGNPAKLEELARSSHLQVTPRIREALARAYAQQGRVWAYQAEATAGKEADALFQQAREMFAAALELKADYYSPLDV